MLCFLGKQHTFVFVEKDIKLGSENMQVAEDAVVFSCFQIAFKQLNILCNVRRPKTIASGSIHLILDLCFVNSKLLRQKLNLTHNS